jgi:formyltetrahydrofolate deformylase
MTLICQDGPGIVLGASRGIVDVGGNIVESDQFSDPLTGLFCMRVSFDSPSGLSEVSETLQGCLASFDPLLTIRPESEHRRALLMVSKTDHCLLDLLYRWNLGELFLNIPLIVSNHSDCAPIADRFGIPFVHLPVSPESKRDSEAELMTLVGKYRIDFIVLARYMQLLSPDICSSLPGKIINIHHSFLPSFDGAQPYRQAYERGVKLIGATAHYVTADLDQGPIIEQGVIRVTHAQTVSDLATMGRDIERTVLAHAVRMQAEDRICLAGNRVVVFSR